MESIELKGRKYSVIVGEKSPVVVNCNLGANSIGKLSSEKEKIDALFNNIDTSPDTMMDLSLFENTGELSQYIIQNYGIPVGVVPIYSIGHKDFDTNAILDIIEQYAQMGVAFMTMHVTADRDIYDVAIKERNIPITSRGGAITLNNAFKHKTENVFRRCLDDIITLAKKYNFVISLGTTYRPASIIDSCDNAHILETQRQIELCEYLHMHNVGVIVENVGHISIDNILEHSLLLKQCNAPIMPLGPSVIDSAIGNDHIAASIGASFMAYNNIAHIINAISPNEHNYSYFSVEDAKAAVIAAKVAARSVNVCKFPAFRDEENKIYKLRSERQSCIISNETPCKRCNIVCPLKMKIYDK